MVVPDEDDDARVRRQLAHLERAIKTHTDERASRLAILRKEQPQLDNSMRALQAIDSGSAEPVMIPRGFVALPTRRAPFGLWEESPSTHAAPDRKQELRTRPPLTKLVNRDHSAIQLLLTILYVAQQETAPGSAFVNNRPNHARQRGSEREPWALLAGVRRAPGSSRARRARLVRALEALNRLEIVEPIIDQHLRRWEGFHLRSADGAGRAGTVLSSNSSHADAVPVPAAFFYNGWHLVLTPAELAMYLVIVDYTNQLPWSAEGIGLPITVRRGTYGITDAVYQSIHMLEEFKLIEIYDTVKNRNRGKIKGFDPETSAPEPYRIVYPGPRSQTDHEPAVVAVIRQLADNPAPPRLTRQKLLLQPLTTATSV